MQQEVGSSLKSSFNVLQTSLCRLHPHWFSIAMTTASKLLQDQPVGNNCGQILHTLGQCSLSDECIGPLLKSSLLQNVINQLVTTLSTINDCSVESFTKNLSTVCSHLAFLTDIAFGHRQAQEWFVVKDHAHFWPLLMKVFNEPSRNFTESELSFCQHTTQQFFGVCCKFSVSGKKLFVNLLLNALSGQYSIECCEIGSKPLQLKLTPFLRTLIIDHVLGPEAVHVIVQIEENFMKTIKGRIKVDSIMPTYNTPHYHPSYPLTDNCYYLKLSSEFTLIRLLSLLLNEETQKVPRSKLHELTKKVSEAKLTESKPTDTNSRKFPQIDIFNFDIKMSKYSETSTKPSNMISFRVHIDDTGLPLTTKIRQIKPSTVYGCSHIRGLTICSPTNESCNTLLSSNYNNKTMLEVFSLSNGLTLLVELFPYIYPGLWSCDQLGTGLVESVDLSMLPSYAPPSFLPSHSYVMLGLGLRLKQYSSLLGDSSLHSNTWYILRGALGATEEGNNF